MKITFIASKLNISKAGSNVSLDTLAEGLVKKGHSISILTLNLNVENKLPSDTSYSVEEVNPHAKAVYRVPSLLLDRVHEKEEDTDIFHVFAPIFAPVLGYYRKQGGDTPVVGRLNSYTMFCTNPSKMDGECHTNCSLLKKASHDDVGNKGRVFKFPLYTYMDYSFPELANYVDRYFAQSPSIGSYYNEAGLENGRISVISNFFNPSFGNQSKVENTADDWEGFNIIYVGRIEDEKGVDTLITSAKFLPDNHHIHILGDGSALQDCKTLAATEGVEHKIQFHGWVDRDELPTYYQNADIFVHPARWPEPSGRAVLEALQYESPIVASDIGGPKWIKGDAGLVFERNDPKDLAKKVKRISSDTVLYAQLKNACSDRLEYFSPDKVLEEIELEYRGLLSEN